MANTTKAAKETKGAAKRVAGQPLVVDTVKMRLSAIEDKQYGNKTAVLATNLKHDKLNNEQDRVRIRREEWRELCKNAGLQGVGLQHVAGKITAEIEIRSFIKGEEYTDEQGNTYKSGYKAIKDADGEIITWENNDESIKDGDELCRAYVVDLIVSQDAKDSAMAFQNAERKAQVTEAKTLSRMSKSERTLYALMKNTDDPKKLAVYLNAMENIDSKSAKNSKSVSSALANEPVVSTTEEDDDE